MQIIQITQIIQIIQIKNLYAVKDIDQVGIDHTDHLSEAWKDYIVIHHYKQ